MSAIIAILGGWRATAFAVLAALAASAYAAEHLRLVAAQSDLAAHVANDQRAQVQAQLAAQTREYETATATAKVAEDYERAKQNAQTDADTVIAGLHAGTVRLRKQWRGCEAGRVSEAQTTATKRDDAADLRATGAGNLVRIAARADAQVSACQAILRAERAKVK